MAILGWNLLEINELLSFWIYPVYLITIKLNHLRKKTSKDSSAKLHRWSITCNLISYTDGFTVVSKSTQYSLRVVSCTRALFSKLSKAEARRGESVVNPCFNPKAAILRKAEREEEEQRRAKRREERRRGCVS